MTNCTYLVLSFVSGTVLIESKDCVLLPYFGGAHGVGNSQDTLVVDT